MKNITIRTQEIAKELGVPMDIAAQMAIAEFQANAPVQVANAQATDKPVKASQPKFFVQAKKEVVWEKKSVQVLKPTYAGGEPPTTVKAYSKDVASAILYVNRKRIAKEFGEDVEYKNFEFHAKTESVGKKLYKFELVQGITKEQWNEWANYKYEQYMTEAQKYDDMKVK